MRESDLLSKSADLTIAVKGIIWGKGYPWETLIPAVNPISYAMIGPSAANAQERKNNFKCRVHIAQSRFTA